MGLLLGKVIAFIVRNSDYRGGVITKAETRFIGHLHQSCNICGDDGKHETITRGIYYQRKRQSSDRYHGHLDHSYKLV